MSFCMNCGFKLPDGAKFCYECGHKQDIAEKGGKSLPPISKHDVEMARIKADTEIEKQREHHDMATIHSVGGEVVKREAKYRKATHFDESTKVSQLFQLGDQKNECHNCGNIISTDNKSVKCTVCGTKLCETCEGYFRDVKRSYGERPLCEKHYKWRKIGDIGENSMGMKFMKIPGRDYYMGKYTVTQKEWKAVMGSTPWKGKNSVREGDDYPATYISWDDCQEFVKKLNAKEGVNKYRHLTEEEWEHACRAGSTTKYCFGDDVGRLADYAWYDENADEVGEEYAHMVGQKKPNQWGLHDMHGNVWEWCPDWYDDEHKYQVIRGGCWYFPDDLCESSACLRCLPDYRDCYLGVRLVRESD